MSYQPPEIAAEIAVAENLPASVYRDPAAYRAQVERVLARGWHFLADAPAAPEPGWFRCATLLPGSLDEPLLQLADGGGNVGVFANVCPHRGHLVAAGEGRAKALKCGYHGRRFDLDGRMLAAPEFEGATGFPGPRDGLAAVPHGTWAGLHFAAVDPREPLAEWLAPVGDRVGWLPLDALRLDPATVRDFEFDGHWALYCDNYLEGFHIPYVHPALAKTLDYKAYRTELFAAGSLQLGVAAAGQPALPPAPAGHPDHGVRVAGYYFFLHPATMLNFYPWGLSLNAVQPLGPARTRVRYREYVWDEAARGRGAGGDLDRVEYEDEAAVASVAAGLASRFYRRGRYSPARERGVHHFHRRLVRELAG